MCSPQPDPCSSRVLASVRPIAKTQICLSGVYGIQAQPRLYKRIALPLRSWRLSCIRLPTPAAHPGRHAEKSHLPYATPSHSTSLKPWPSLDHLRMHVILVRVRGMCVAPAYIFWSHMSWYQQADRSSWLDSQDQKPHWEVYRHEPVPTSERRRSTHAPSLTLSLYIPVIHASTVSFNEGSGEMNRHHCLLISSTAQQKLQAQHERRVPED